MFLPLPRAQFDAYKAAHLMWRAGFGCTWEEAGSLARMGLDATVDALINFPKTGVAQPACAIPPRETDSAFYERTKHFTDAEREQAIKERGDESTRIGELKVWWLSRILDTRVAPAGAGAADTPPPAPLQEKMTLFWHSHFATSFADKIEHCHPMWQQNQMYRDHALDPFPKLLARLIRDPAMLAWLDNADSRREHPNENFARELMELFSLGVGHYTEADVKAGARCLTGYGIDRDTWSFRFLADAHDPGDKTYLGETGKWGADDVVRIICRQDACARFMARKFLSYFVYENPEPELVEQAAQLYRASGYKTADFLRTIFTSQLFYSPRAVGCIVKSPVVLAAGALKAMGVSLPEKDVLTGALRLMGQDLFFPPEVNGWLGGTAWINSNMLLVRYNFSNYLLNGVSPDEFKVFDKKTAGGGQARRRFVEGQRQPNQIDWSPRAQLRASGADSRMVISADIVDYYIKQFLQRPVSRDLRDQLLAFAETDAAGGRRSYTLNDSNFDERTKGLVHLIMSSPDYQLC